jgi:hypothetical protein
MGCVSGFEDAGSVQMDAFSASEVDGGRGVEPDARVAVVVVVPAEEASTEISAIFNRAEAIRELRTVFEGFV